MSFMCKFPFWLDLLKIKVSHWTPIPETALHLCVCSQIPPLPESFCTNGSCDKTQAASAGIGMMSESGIQTEEVMAGEFFFLAFSVAFCPSAFGSETPCNST